MTRPRAPPPPARDGAASPVFGAHLLETAAAVGPGAGLSLAGSSFGGAMRRSKAEVERYIASVQGSAPSAREVSGSGQAGVMAPGGLGSGWSGGGGGRCWRGAAEHRRRGDGGRPPFLLMAARRGPTRASVSARSAGLGRTAGLVWPRQAPWVSWNS